MAPLETLYGRKCRSTVCRIDTSSWSLVLKKTVKLVKVIQEKFTTSEDQEKNYADLKGRDEEFQVGENVLL